jgi:phosphoglycolate phosphatase
MKKEIIGFDLDGVIINSLKNMENAWNYACKKNNLNISFEKYKKLIGLPFTHILKKLKIKKNYKKIQQDYRYFSLKDFKSIKCYDNIKKLLNKLKKNYKIVIITSKEKNRSLFVLKKNNIKYDMLVTPNDVKKGKPDPESMNKVIKKFLFKKESVLFVGDTYFDYKFAKNSKVDFVFANWGYGNIKIKNIKKINKPYELLDIIK